MSYDIDVFATELQSEGRRAEFADAAGQSDGLPLADPVSVQDEGLPDLVRARRLEVVAVYAISGPADSATAFAHRLAEATRGAVLARPIQSDDAGPRRWLS